MKVSTLSTILVLAVVVCLATVAASAGQKGVNPKSTTKLVFPYAVSSNFGFVDQVSISNTGDSSGTCLLTFYPDNTNFALTTPAIHPGGFYQASTGQFAVPGAEGFIIAVCNFPGAYGFSQLINGLGQRVPIAAIVED